MPTVSSAEQTTVRCGTVLEEVRQVVDGRLLEEPVDRHLHPERGPALGEHRDRRARAAAEIEEILVRLDVRHRQQLVPDVGQSALRGVGQQPQRVHRRGDPRGRDQLFHSDFPVLRPGQPGDRDDPGRQDVPGQPPEQELAQLPVVDGLLSRGLHPGHGPAVAADVVDEPDGRLHHTGEGRQSRGDACRLRGLAFGVRRYGRLHVNGPFVPRSWRRS